MPPGKTAPPPARPNQLLKRNASAVGAKPGGALLFPASLAALLAAVSLDMSRLWIFVCAAAAGASFPPITVCMRTYLRQRLRDDALLTAAYSLDSVLIETMFIFGPLLVALFVAFASPSMAVAFVRRHEHHGRQEWEERSSTVV